MESQIEERSSKILKDKERVLASFDSYLKNYIDNVNERNQRFALLCRNADSTMHQLSFAMMASVDTNELKLSRVQFIREVQDFEEAASKIRASYKELSSYLDQVNNMNSEIDIISSIQNLQPERMKIVKTLSIKVKTLQQTLGAAQKSTEALLAPADKIIQDMNKEAVILNGLFLKSLEHHYLQNSTPIFSEKMRSRLIPICHAWLISVDLLVGKKLPNSLPVWTKIALIFLSITLTGFLFFSYIVKKFTAKINIIAPNTKYLLYKSILFFSASAGLYFAVRGNVDFPESIIFYFLWILTLSRAAMDLSWALRNIRQQVDYKSSNLTPLYFLYLVSCLYQFFNIPSVLLCLIWLLALLLGIIAICMDKSYNNNTGRTLKPILIFTCSIFLIVSAAGYVHLSMLFTAFLFMLLVGVQFSFSGSEFFRRFIVKFLKNHKIVQALILGIGIPAIWFSIIYIVLLWCFTQYLSRQILHDVTSGSYKIWDMTINIEMLVCAAFLFFVVKTMLHVLESSLFIKFGSNENTGGILPVFNTILRYAFWTIYIFVVLKIVGINISNIAIVAGGLSVGIGMGLQGFVSSFVNGIIMLVNRTVRVGDVIQIDNMQAKVLKIDLRNTIVQTYDNAIVSVPNSQILNNKFINWTLNNKLVRRQIDVKVKTAVIVDDARNMLLKIASGNENVKKYPAPEVLLSELSNDGIVFSLKIWIDDLDHESNIMSDLRYVINETMKANGMI